MPYSAKILADSISPAGKRLVTMEITFPRFVLAEFATHRVFSKNAASSRAIPIEKMIERVENDPVLPVYWGKNQKGMQAAEELGGTERYRAAGNWLDARDGAVLAARLMISNGVHKQIVNRLLEPWLWITVIVSATEWANFFNLRCHPDAQPELRHIAEMMRDLYYSHEPSPVEYGGWHLPLVPDAAELYAAKYTGEDVKKIAVGRCARVSYLTHDGKRDPQADIDLSDRLATAGHMSPFEHVATPSTGCVTDSNFIGWVQYRKCLPNENRDRYEWPVNQEAA